MENGGYDLEGVIWHQHSNRLLIKIMELFPKEIPIVDLGCGHNFYVTVLNYAGYRAIGFDKVNLGNVFFMEKDLTKKFPFYYKNEEQNIISLEVGEHIPAEKASVYIDNLCMTTGDIILSWAIPGQAGVGHINCQSNEWVQAEMLKRNYMIDPEKTLQLRESVKDCHCTWFRNTLMYFTPCE